MLNVLALPVCTAGAVCTFLVARDSSNNIGTRMFGVLLCVLNVAGVALNALCVAGVIE